MNPNREDYLQAVYRLTLREGYATNKSLADYLGFSKPSVTEMIKKLHAEGLVLLEKNRIMLSAHGTEKAQHMLSKHRLWEYFLTEVLHLEGEIVHNQADLLEHATTPELFAALNAYLQYPSLSPRGKDIYTNLQRDTETTTE